MVKKDKEFAIKNILKYFKWIGARMIFPTMQGQFAVIELSDLIKIIKFKKKI